MLNYASFTVEQDKRKVARVRPGPFPPASAPNGTDFACFNEQQHHTLHAYQVGMATMSVAEPAQRLRFGRETGILPVAKWLEAWFLNVSQTTRGNDRHLLRAPLYPVG